VAEYGLTEAEQAVLKMPGEFFRAFEALPQLHPADLEEVASTCTPSAGSWLCAQLIGPIPISFRTSPGRRSSRGANFRPVWRDVVSEPSYNWRMLGARVFRWVPFLNRYAEMAPACCNACRTCTTTNIFNLAALIGGVAAAPFVRTLRLLRRRFA
jgi:hypothetical protein